MPKKNYNKPEASKKQLEQELLEVSEALWDANVRLAAEEKARTELLSNLSHDLRASMTALSSAVELLKSGHKIEKEQYDELLNLMERRINMQKAILDDLFLLTKLDCKSLSLKKEYVNCGLFLEEYYYSCVADPKYKECKLRIMVPEQFPYIVEIDAQAINRVLDNLFTNAFKYSGQNVRICLGAKKEGNEVWVYVEDNGEGISGEDMPFIFDRSFRASQSRTPDEGGSGLGLAIAKGIIEQHGGKIWCESALGCGSCFTFSLPIRSGGC